jgi:hypothetical protein
MPSGQLTGHEFRDAISKQVRSDPDMLRTYPDAGSMTLAFE